MNRISIALNAVLLIAVAVLFYLYFSLNGKLPDTDNSLSKTDSTKKVKVVTDPKVLENSKLAFVNVDSLLTNYQYIIDQSKDIQVQKAGLEGSLNSMVNKFQEAYQSLQEAYQAGIRSEADLQKEAERLQQKQNDMAGKERQLQNLSQYVAELQVEMLQRVSTYIDKYNSGKFDFILAYSSNVSSILYAKPELDITADIINGLNEEYKNEKAAAEATKPKKK